MRRGAYDFIKARPVRIIFSRGCLGRVGAQELERQGASRIVVIASPRMDKEPSFQQLISSLGNRVVGRLSEVAQHNPPSLIEESAKMVEGCKTDWLMVVGGGSAIGIAKAIVGRSSPSTSTPIRIGVCPTTYSGSEMTDLYGVSMVRDNIGP